MNRVSDAEKRKVFRILNQPGRLCFKIAHARKGNSGSEPAAHDSTALRASARRTAPAHAQLAKEVLRKFGEK